MYSNSFLLQPITGALLSWSKERNIDLLLILDMKCRVVRLVVFKRRNDVLTCTQSQQFPHNDNPLTHMHDKCTDTQTAGRLTIRGALVSTATARSLAPPPFL